MVALRISPDGRRHKVADFLSQYRDHQPRSRRPSVRRSSSTRRVLTLDASPMDAWQHGRIEPVISIQVRQITHGGLEVDSERPVSPGRRLALGFPDSPFLPPPGTVARVAGCTPTDHGFTLQLTYEACNAA